MSREFRFRAWETVSKEMFYQVRCGGMFDNMATVPTTWNGSDWIHLIGGEYTKVMQYTGLIDKVDNEIYEGDIIKTIDGIMEIRYMKDSFQCIDCKGRNHRLLNYIYSGYIIVIGNKYENPELLEGNKYEVK